MDIHVEFTKEPTVGDWQDIVIAVTERQDNLDLDQLPEESIELLEKIKTAPHSVVRLDEYRLLLEMAALTKKMWHSHQTLKMYFFDGTTTISTRILEYASIWSNYCSIKFEETPHLSEATIRVGLEPPGSWSYLGTDALQAPKSKPTVNFGWLTSSLSDRDFKQVVLHEFGHVLGLIHEHQSPAIKINWNKPFVYNYFWLNYRWPPEQVDRNIFEEYAKTSTNHSSVDRSSIMAYYIPPEFTTDGQSFPQNFELSTMDKQYIGKLYPKILQS